MIHTGDIGTHITTMGVMEFWTVWYWWVLGEKCKLGFNSGGHVLEWKATRGVTGPADHCGNKRGSGVSGALLVHGNCNL